MKVTNTEQFVAVCTSLRENTPEITALDFSDYIEFDHVKALLLLGDLTYNTYLKSLRICKKNIHSYPLSIESLEAIFEFFISSKTLNNLFLSPWQISYSSQKHSMLLAEEFAQSYDRYKLHRNDELKTTIVYEMMEKHIEGMDRKLRISILEQEAAKRGKFITIDYDRIRSRKFLPLDKICEFADIAVSKPRKFFAPQ